jgi:SH3-like domain-containing protein
MKKNCWLFLGVMLATTAVAQVNTNKLPVIPAPVVAAKTAPAPAPAAPAALPFIAPEKAAPDVVTKTNAPAKKAVVKPHKKKVVAKVAEKSAVKKTAVAAAPVTLVAGPATVSADHVNYRGQAGLKGEAVGHLKKGDTVTVISEINLDKHAADEPAQWAKIALPAGTKAWVNAKFIDATTKTVSAKKLNLRGGPGENYSVLGAIEKGTIINEITNKGDWKQIEAPTNAFAFVAASYLRQEVPVTTPAAPVVEPVPAVPTLTNTVVEPTPIMTQPTTIPAAPATTVPPAMVPNVPLPVVPAVPAFVVPAVSTNDVSDEDDTNLPPRIVTHEGTVRRSVSPVAPTSYELYSPLTDKAINYLFTSSTNLNLGRYNGMTITVTGEEGLEARWRDTPVLTIQKIYVLPGNAKTDKTAKSQQ